MIRGALKPLAVLRKREEFLAAAARGKKWVAPGLILQMGAARAHDIVHLPIRYGLTASGKIGNAVKRNRARRRLRALAVEILAVHAAPGFDYVLIARAAALTRDFADLREDLKTALKKLGAWREDNN